MEKKRVLFLCVSNSARSQLAEGLLRDLYPDSFDVFSAGIHATQVHPFALEAMKEIGIDISRQYSKSLEIYKDKEFDYVVSLCDLSKSTCPYFPNGKKIMHHEFPDPSSSEYDKGHELNVFRKVRDEIKSWIKKTFDPNTHA